MPSNAVDEAWHEMILMTREYTWFCEQAFGRYLHHSPDSTLDVSMDALLAETLAVVDTHDAADDPLHRRRRTPASRTATSGSATDLHRMRDATDRPAEQRRKRRRAAAAAAAPAATAPAGFFGFGGGGGGSDGGGGGCGGGGVRRRRRLRRRRLRRSDALSRAD